MKDKIPAAAGMPCWLWNRTFIPVIFGPKHISGLVVEADGLHAMSVPRRDQERLEVLKYRGRVYPPERTRRFVKRRKPASQRAKELRKRLLALL